MFAIVTDPRGFLAPGVIPGIDFAGEVVKIGKSLDPKVSFKVGDRVSGAVHGGTVLISRAFDQMIDYGTYTSQEHTKIEVRKKPLCLAEY